MKFHSQHSRPQLLDRKSFPDTVQLMANAIIESSDDAIISKDLNGTILSWNKGAEKIFGYKPEEVIGESVSILIPADRDNEEPEIIQRIRQDQRIDHYETIRQRKDGSLIDISLTVSPIKNGEGIIIGASKIARDITARKKMEAALQQSEMRYRQLVQGLPAAVYLCDAQGRITLYNDAAVALWGRKPEIGKDLWCGSWRIYWGDGTPVALDECPMAIALKQGCPVRGKEIIVERADGTRRNVLPHPEPIFDKNGMVIGAVNMLMDITDMKLAQKKIEETVKELGRSNKELESFAYVVSHDIKEPLNIVSAFADLLEMRSNDKLDQNQKEYIQHIKEGAEQARTFVRGVLEYSQIGHNKFYETVDTSFIVAQGLANLRLSIEESRADIQYGKMPKIKANPLEILQLFQNLIANALKYKSEAVPVIFINATLKDNAWLFSIKDNGVGIDPQSHNRIFEMFGRADFKSEQLGSGIGLAICKKIVEHHGGKIWVDSQLGQGSTFYFSINPHL